MSEDLSIPAFLLVKNRPKDKVPEIATVEAKYVEPWKEALSKLEREDLRKFIADNIDRGRFMPDWLVVGHRRSQADVNEMVAHWLTKLESTAAATSARAAKVKLKRKAGKVEPPAKLDPASVLAFGGKNPKKPGTAPHKRWELLIAHDGRTVGEYLKAKGSNPKTLTNAISSGHVTLTEGKGVEEPKKKKRK